MGSQNGQDNSTTAEITIEQLPADVMVHVSDETEQDSTDDYIVEPKTPSSQIWNSEMTPMNAQTEEWMKEDEETEPRCESAHVNVTSLHVNLDGGEREETVCGEVSIDIVERLNDESNASLSDRNMKTGPSSCGRLSLSAPPSPRSPEKEMRKLDPRPIETHPLTESDLTPRERARQLEEERSNRPPIPERAMPLLLYAAFQARKYWLEVTYALETLIVGFALMGFLRSNIQIKRGASIISQLLDLPPEAIKTQNDFLNDFAVFSADSLVRQYQAFQILYEPMINTGPDVSKCW